MIFMQGAILLSELYLPTKFLVLRYLLTVVSELCPGQDVDGRKDGYTDGQSDDYIVFLRGA